jgi:methyltransferase FkbM-like protein
LEILDVALSDSEREGRLILGGSSEYNALGDVGAGETVHITSLDIENAKRKWVSPDFIKIDAEGEEERILKGGREFFAQHSPLIMFEIKAGDAVNKEFAAAFLAMGYQLFRLLVGEPILVPVDFGVPLDPYDYNLFAAKPDRIRSLRDEGFLVDQLSAWEPSGEAISNALSSLRQRAFAPAFGHILDNPKQIDPDYAKALAGFAVWRAGESSASTRCAALFFAYRTLAALCNRSPTTARYSTFARLAWEGGWRGECVIALDQMATYIQRRPFQPTEPCWPPNPRFDDIAVGDNLAVWFATSVVEQLVRTQNYSTCFGGVSPLLGWLCEQPLAAHDMYRRKVLLAAREGLNPTVPSSLKEAAPDHLNADIWRTGKVPGTRLDQ